MEINEYIIKCPKRDFTCIEFKFNHNDSKDVEQLNKLISSGRELATKVNPALAMDSSHTRDFETVLKNAIAGVLAEFCWRYWLNDQARKMNVNLEVKTTEFKNTTNQIDMIVSYSHNVTKSIEVRSSFPYTGLKNAVCRAFRILGWYTNPIKTKEIQKDYYVGVLFPFEASEFYEKLKSELFSCYLSGGATRKLLQQSEHAKDKELIPYYDIDMTYSPQVARYRVIEPIVNGYDAKEITQHILRGNE